MKLNEADKAKLEAKKKAQYAEQVAVDKQLLANIKKVDMLKKYLSARFTITKGQKVHELKFWLNLIYNQELTALGLGSSKGLLFSKKSLTDPSGLLYLIIITVNLDWVFAIQL